MVRMGKIVISVIATTGYNEILSSPNRRYKRFLLYMQGSRRDILVYIAERKSIFKENKKKTFYPCFILTPNTGIPKGGLWFLLFLKMQTRTNITNTSRSIEFRSVTDLHNNELKRCTGTSKNYTTELT